MKRAAMGVSNAGGNVEDTINMKEMKDHWATRPRGVVVLIVPLAMAIILGTAGCKKEAPASLPPPVVQVLDVAATNAPMHTEIIGQLDSPQNVQVRARVEAFVAKIVFTEGEPVKEGDRLFQLD